jgi:HK97 family phage major capsid protein
MPENNDDAPKLEPVGEPRDADKPEITLDALRSEVESIVASTKKEIVKSFTDQIEKLSEPNRDKVPAPDVQRDNPSGIKVTGHASDPLYRNLPDYEKPYRTPQIDELSQRWMIASHEKDHETRRAAERELNDLVRANEIAEGTASTTGGIGSGTGAPLLPVALANVISETRNRSAKIRQRAQVFTTPNQQLRIPRGGVATASMVAEGATASNFDSALTSVLLDKKKMQARFAITKEMLADTPFNLVSYFVRRAGQAMGQLEDVQFATGTGESVNITTGIEQIGGETNVIPTVAGRLSYPDLVALVYGIGEQWTENAGLYGNVNAMRLLSALTDGDGRPQLVPSVNAPETVGDQLSGNRMQVLGREILQLPFTTSGTNSNLVDIWFADLKEYAILDGGGFEVASSEHVEFDSDRIVWKITQRIDGAPLQVDSFARLVAVSGTNNGSTANTFL